MAKITRIKASDPGAKAQKEPEKPVPESPEKDAPEKASDEEGNLEFSEKEARAHKKLAEKERKAMQKAEKRKVKLEDQEAQGGSKVKRILTAPFRYLRDSWREIRQVRWPNRKATWKMVFAIFIYSALFIALIMLLDVLFTWLFNLILK
ncbi:preprotein translocase subunit SecE [Candidatus Saccharibacteria bacterium]|nr:preprotein translocase subunit SecE [Candidatus Saccharibacteria bacterium]